MKTEIIMNYNLMKIYTPLVFTATAILSFSCAKKQEKTVPAQSPNTAQPSQKTTVKTEKKYTSCEDFITDMVKSSNASALKTFNDPRIRIEEIASEKIIIEIYVSNDISEDPAVKQITDHAVGWLEYFPASEKLQDITADPEEPEILKYDHSVLDQKEIMVLCFPN
ncbi:hypothetical protein P2W68_20595 [Chryseobacterium arthrosphaerae]|uniref:hypothetical protein n=1 Tax=Chryseobacterium arthrosphaerae TaxID=651561 RepID=UPI0023E2EB92|nr:hypothetical protein [Chryseobacterium arthrosphaerae]WES97212.1 hypothetical protein P2W68_20595 [Chryseobacterium arthrosphaerae]